MIDSSDSRKASIFITNLINSPNIKNENLFVAETMIHTFISQNKIQLLQTLKTPQYFPHLDSAESMKLIITELYKTVKNQALEPIYAYIQRTDFSVLNKITDATTFPANFHREKILSFVDTIFKIREVRSNFSSTYNIFKYEIIEKYLTEIFNRRDFIYNELVRVQKNYLEIDEYIVYLKIILLLRGIIHMRIALDDSDSERSYCLSDIMKMPGKMPMYMNRLAHEVKIILPSITDKSVSIAVKSNLSDSLTSIDEGSARLLYILCARFHNYQPVSKIDRGAESPDKSWFAIARKNARIFGFEKNMLEELYRIAGDNNW